MRRTGTGSRDYSPFKNKERREANCSQNLEPLVTALSLVRQFPIHAFSIRPRDFMWNDPNSFHLHPMNAVNTAKAEAVQGISSLPESAALSCASLASYSLLQQPSHVPFISDWTKNIGSNQRCFKHLNSKIFGLGSTHNREWFFFFLNLVTESENHSVQFPILQPHQDRNRQCMHRSTGLRRLFTQTWNLKRTNLQSSYSEPHYI